MRSRFARQEVMRKILLFLTGHQFYVNLSEQHESDKDGRIYVTVISPMDRKVFQKK